MGFYNGNIRRHSTSRAELESVERSDDHRRRRDDNKRTQSGTHTAWNAPFGLGDGSTTFTLPDLRGEFIRGWDDGRSVDTNRGIGSFQADELKSHNHNHIYSWFGQNGLYHPNDPASIASGLNNPTNGNGAIQNTGGSETRPRNVALLACIKY